MVLKAFIYSGQVEHTLRTKSVIEEVKVKSRVVSILFAHSFAEGPILFAYSSNSLDVQLLKSGSISDGTSRLLPAEEPSVEAWLRTELLKARETHKRAREYFILFE
jgi:hypothetical protein